MERAEKGKGLDGWLKKDRKQRREEAARQAALAKLGERCLGLLRVYDKPEDSDDIAFWEGFADDVELAAKELGLL